MVLLRVHSSHPSIWHAPLLDRPHRRLTPKLCRKTWSVCIFPLRLHEASGGPISVEIHRQPSSSTWTVGAGIDDSPAFRTESVAFVSLTECAIG
jgi:hypothetical protein